MRLLLISPHFAPTNAPDGQRLRLLIPEWVKAGCDCTLVSAYPEDCLAPIESDLLATLPQESYTHHRIKAWPRFLGVSNIGLRLKANLDRFVSRLLEKEKFDVVYFSTTQFACLPLAKSWQKKHGLPYVVDLQDPWVNDYYEQPGAPKPPGGWKYRWARWKARRQEPRVFRSSSHIVSVSPDYLTTLQHRYDWFTPDRGSVLPFGWSIQDQNVARQLVIEPTREPVIRYLGRVGDDMEALLDQLFAWFATWKKNLPVGNLLPRWEFIGTSYAGPTGGGLVQTLAHRHGLSEQVSEQPGRIGYLKGLALLQSSWANLILGSDDRGYSPSKTWPVIATGRPWLAMTWADSVIHRALPQHSSAGLLLAAEASPAQSANQWFDTLVKERAQDHPIPPELEPLSAPVLAQKHLDIFQRAVTET